MDIKKYMAIPGEKPLDNIVDDGGFCAIFRTIACIGDSLASGEFQVTTPLSPYGVVYYDHMEYSWGQFIARMTGATVYNFSRGGMTAHEYLDTFAEDNNMWDIAKRAQCYILALGVNDIINQHIPFGSVDDIDLADWHNNNNSTFAGRYAQIIQRYREIAPNSPFFLVSMPRRDDPYWSADWNELARKHSELLCQIAALFDNTYVIDLYRYAPIYDKEFFDNFFLEGHMSPTGYLLSAKMIASYIDYIIRNNPEKFKKIGLIGTPYENA
ncbi:MAG: SGNH/GDSL hydrolase family protein [Clostridia bacterium]|nr:SGNH/GDSL hydrolase family protein [Clostridia bacterium]